MALARAPAPGSLPPPVAGVAADGITVRDLVVRGRTPHTSLWRQWSAADEAAVLAALSATRMTELADRPDRKSVV